MKKFELNGAKYSVIECTAIADCDNNDESKRQEALLVLMRDEDGECRDDSIVFGWNMPETVEDFMDMCEDSYAWVSQSETLDSAIINEKTYDEWRKTDGYAEP